MRQTLHDGACTTEAVHRTIQESQESIVRLAKRYALNPKTMAKWKQLTHVHDVPMGPRHPRSTSLTPQEEALIVAFRKHTLLPLDDCLLLVGIAHHAASLPAAAWYPSLAGGDRRCSGAENVQALSPRLLSYRHRVSPLNTMGWASHDRE
jgi:hypothetical protein